MNSPDFWRRPTGAAAGPLVQLFTLIALFAAVPASSQTPESDTILVVNIDSMIVSVLGSAVRIG